MLANIFAVDTLMPLTYTPEKFLVTKTESPDAKVEKKIFKTNEEIHKTKLLNEFNIDNTNINEIANKIVPESETKKIIIHN